MKRVSLGCPTKITGCSELWVARLRSLHPYVPHFSPRRHWRVKQAAGVQLSPAACTVTMLPDCGLPFREPARGPRGFRGGKVQFPCQLNQVVGDVDVIEGLGKT